MDILKQKLKRKKDNWTVSEIQIVYRPVMIDQPKIVSSNDAYFLIKNFGIIKIFFFKNSSLLYSLTKRKE